MGKKKVKWLKTSKLVFVEAADVSSHIHHLDQNKKEGANSSSSGVNATINTTTKCHANTAEFFQSE